MNFGENFGSLSVVFFGKTLNTLEVRGKINSSGHQIIHCVQGKFEKIIDSFRLAKSFIDLFIEAIFDFNNELVVPFGLFELCGN